MSDCGACTGEINIKLCHDHTTTLEQHLAEVDDMVDNLGVSIARQDKGAPAIGGGSPTGSKPPINLDIMERYDQLRSVLAGWATALEGNNIFTRASTKDIASYLFTRIDTVRTTEWAYDLLDELSEAMNASRLATDRAAERIVVGRCQTIIEGIRCPDTVTAIQGQTHGRCKTCGATVNIHEHQQWMLAEAWHVHAPLRRILRALKHGNHATLPMTRVEWWIKKGTLTPSSGNLYTAAAVMHAYWQTPSGRKVAPESYILLGAAA